MKFSIKALAVAIAFLVTTSSLCADQIRFLINNFDWISIETGKGKESVQVYQAKNQAPKTVFQSRLRPSGPGVYVTPQGTVFTLKHFLAPIIKDPNRGINSGDWQLTVTGEGEEFAKLKPQIVQGRLWRSFPPLVYLGKKVRQPTQ